VVGGDNPSLRIHANTHCTRMTSNGNIFDKSSIWLDYSKWAVGVVICNQDFVIGINEEVEGVEELTITNMTNKIALKTKEGNTIVAELTNGNVSIRQQAKTPWGGKLTISISRRPEFPQELAI